MENIKSILKKLSFPINVNLFTEHLTQHPAYPSLRSLSDTFDEWHIPNMAVKISPIQLSEISYPAMAYCKSNTDEYYVLLESYKDEKITYIADGKKEITLSVEDFAKIWTGVVLLLAPDEKSGHPEAQKLNKKYKIQQIERFISSGAGLFIILLILTVSNGFLNAGVFLTTLIGLTASIFLLQNEFGKPNELIAQFCKFGKQTDCNTILKSSASKLFGWLSWSEIGFLYFGGFLLSVVISFLTLYREEIFVILLIINAIALPYTVFSIYYQAFVAKKWCTLCLVVQVVLWIDFILLFSHFNRLNTIDYQAVMVSGISFLSTILGWFLYKPLLLKSKSIIDTEKLAASYYRNTDIFLAYLDKQRIVDIDTFPDEIVLGNKDANMEILIVCGVFCKPCAKAHNELENLIDYYGEDMKIIIRFVSDIDKESERNKVTKHILSLPLSVQHQAVKDWFEIMNYEKWSDKYPFSFVSHAQELLEKHNNWCNNAKITHTPTIFINGRELAVPYNYNHLKYHIRSLSEILINN